MRVCVSVIHFAIFFFASFCSPLIRFLRGARVNFTPDHGRYKSPLCCFVCVCSHPSIHDDDCTSKFGNNFARALFAAPVKVQQFINLEQRDASVRDKRDKTSIQRIRTSAVLHGMIIFKMKIVILMLLLLICLPKGLHILQLINFKNGFYGWPLPRIM